jgi:predicted metal-dependent hydrolase
MKVKPNENWEPLEVAIPRDVFLAEVEAWARRMAVRPKSVQLRAMARKWGSCSTAGRVTFDIGLLRQHAEFRKRVIVEELLHLRIPNHGKLFKALLQAFLDQIDSPSEVANSVLAK